MEIDLAQLDESAAGSDLLRAEICIVGGGIAGLTLARELVRLGHEVLLLEAGGANPREGQSSEDVIQIGQPHPGTMEQGVIRGFGGTSLVWGGQLLPLPADAKWPVTATELSSYCVQAERLLGVDALAYGAQRFFEELGKPSPDLLMKLPRVDCLLSKFAPFSHRNLARTVGRELRKHNKARIAFNARVVELMLSPGRDSVEAVIVLAPSGRTYRVEAKQIAVAAGTIDTVRLLLASHSVAEEGVGNVHDQVGRNFHDHLTVAAATLRGAARRELLGLRPWIHAGTTHAFKLSAGEGLRREQELNPILAHITVEEPINGGIGAIRNLLRARQQGRAAGAVRAALPELPRATSDGTLLAISAGLRHRRYVSPRADVQIRLNVAQQCPSASRLTLAQDGRAVLDWKIADTEIASLRKFAGYLREGLRLDGIDWEPSLFEPEPRAVVPKLDDARHTMGGACMGTDPRSSVVDSELRVHGLTNLFIASAAAFPDGSPQLPTLPLMALAIRLAGHLHRHI